MAKQQAKEVKKFEFSKIGSILDNISKTVPIQVEKEIKEKKFISTGVYISRRSNVWTTIKWRCSNKQN